MAATTITPDTVTRAGVDLTGSAATATDGDCFTNTGKEFFVVFNGGGSPTTVTLKFGTNGKVDGQAATERTASVAAGKSYAFGPFPTHEYNTSGKVTIVCNPTASVTVKAITCSPA